MHIIPLGDGCSVSWLLDSCYFTRQTGLFEWCRSDYFKDIIYAINNIDNIEAEPYKLPGNVCIKETDIHTSHYPFYSFKDKIKRRAKRFIDMVKSDTEILFIRRAYYTNITSINELEEFDKAIKNINPHCKYKFLLLQSNGELLTGKNIYHKKVEVNTMEEPKNNDKKQEDIETWKNIFKEFNIDIRV